MRISFFLVLLCILGVSQSVLGQSQTYLNEEDTEWIPDTLIMDSSYFNLVIVPFEPKMYRSEIDRMVGEANGLNFQEVRGYFRLGLDNALNLAAKERFPVVRMHADEASVNRDLMHIYASVGYQYRDYEPEPEPTQNPIKKLKRKLDEREEEKAPKAGARIENGQLVSVARTKDGFMAVDIRNPELIGKMAAKYHGALFLFINELDLLLPKDGDYRAFEQGEYQNQIRIHFSIYDKDENELYSGFVDEYFPSTTTDIREIIAQHFTVAAEEVVKKLPVLFFFSQASVQRAE